MRGIGKAFVLVFGMAAVFASGLSAQPTLRHIEATVCPSPYRPFSGLTFHEGETFEVTYYTYPEQIGYAEYVASPSPAYSDDRTAVWRNPGVLAECSIGWYYNPSGSFAYVEFLWHIVTYHGTVSQMGDCGDDEIYTGAYDPYFVGTPTDTPVNGPCDDGGGPGGGGGGSGGGGAGGQLVCHFETVQLEISYDGGVTWDIYWTGLVNVCAFAPPS